MIARQTPVSNRQDASLEALSQEQERCRHRGVQVTYSQAEIGRRLGVSRARIEQIEIVAKLKLLKRLAVGSPQHFLDLGGTYAQLAFLRNVTIGSAAARRVWRQWCRLGQERG